MSYHLHFTDGQYSLKKDRNESTSINYHERLNSIRKYLLPLLLKNKIKNKNTTYIITYHSNIYEMDNIKIDTEFNSNVYFIGTPCLIKKNGKYFHDTIDGSKFKNEADDIIIYIIEKICEKLNKTQTKTITMDNFIWKDIFKAEKNRRIRITPTVRSGAGVPESQKYYNKYLKYKTKYLQLKKL